MPTGSKYATGDRAWGLCQKCGLQFLLRTLVFDGYYPNLRVCVGCYDSRQPQEFLVDVTDPTALWKPSPEWGPENPQLTGAVFANEGILSWTECIPRGGSRVAAYLAYRSISTDGVNFTASVQIANLPVIYYVDLADLVENGNPKYDNEGIELEFLAFTDTIPQGCTYVRYQVFAQLTSGRLANSNVLTLPVISAGAVGSIASGADLTFASLAAFLPPVGNAVESIQSGADFTAGSFTSVDPDFGSVVILMQFDDGNNSQAFIDSSLVASTWSVQAGNPREQTAAPKFGIGALFCNGGSAIVTPATPGGPLDIYDGDFTIEGWAFNASASFQQVIIDYGDVNVLVPGHPGQSSGGIRIYTDGNTQLSVQADFLGWEDIVVPITGIPLNTYFAWAVTRNGAQGALYLNGVQTLANIANWVTPSPTLPANWAGNTPYGFHEILIGGSSNSALQTTFFSGNLDEIRVTKGVARYTGNYTPTGPFPTS